MSHMPSAGLAPQIPKTIQSKTKIQTNMECTGRNRELLTFEPSSQGKNKRRRMKEVLVLVSEALLFLAIQTIQTTSCEKNTTTIVKNIFIVIIIIINGCK